jgi:aryl-alcohol dehydrogenase-like predicted oxidoreductase
MNQRLLGRSGIRVSEIAFGGVEIGLPYGIGVTSETDMLSEKEAIHLLHSAIDSGINFFDTARMYGTSEKIMGRAFKDRREQVVISTKCRHFREKDQRLPPSDKLREIIDTSLQESLTALQTTYIDIYMLHQADLEVLKNETIATTFLNLKKNGLIRAMGVSTYSVEETRTALKSGVWDVIQLPFNLMNQSHESQFLLAAQLNVGIMIRSVLFKGILSEKGNHLHSELHDVQMHLNLYDELLNETIPDLPTLAIKFALSFTQVSSVLVGIDRLEYLNKSLTVADGNYLDKKTLTRAKTLGYPDPQFLDLVKWDKMGWL